MTIPAHLQLFDSPVILIPKDEARLRPHLVNTRTLRPVIAGMNEPDLQRLIVMELLGERRWSVVERMLMKLGKLERVELEKRVRRLCR